MRFRTDPPDPAEFPRHRLLWPPAVPAVIGGLAWLAYLGGHQWNIHGDGAVLMLTLLIALVVGLVASGISLWSVVPALRQHPSLRTVGNLACTAVAAVFFTGGLAYFAISSAFIATGRG
jgi:hypothetical protein